ncbi:MAG: efflux RND transporter periplasmic adaptor subunit, partial [Polyangiaceae bacterium]
SQQANIRRLTQMKSFARVTAPFAGRVVTRTVERGALVTAGNATPLFRIASTDTVRVFVQVPQDLATSVKVDAPAKVTVREYPGRAFEAKVTRSAGALDAQTRTMTVEVRVPNPKGELLSGMFAEVAFTASLPHRVFEVPGTALYNDGKGTRVAVVDEENRIRLRPVTIERDTGPTLHLASGVDETARVVKLASAELVDGTLVEAATAASK